MPDLDELRRLREQATPGPWRQGNVATNQVFAPFDYGLVGPGGERVVCTVNARSDEWDWRADARLIAAAVNALPEMLTELYHLRSRVEESEQQLAKARGTIERLCAENDRLARSLDKAWRDLEPGSE